MEDPTGLPWEVFTFHARPDGSSKGSCCFPWKTLYIWGRTHENNLWESFLQAINRVVLEPELLEDLELEDQQELNEVAVIGGEEVE